MKFFFILCVILVSACSSHRPELENKDVCFLLFNIKTGTFEKIVNKTRCEERFPAVSTFKIPLSVMAFDSKLLQDKNSKKKWDGKISMVPSWNKDHTALSWMQDSVIWYSQKLTLQLGKEKVEKYLASFDYGNADMSGGIRYAWLTPAPFISEEMENSLKISGFEQIHFLKKLWRGELKASIKAQEVTKDLLSMEVSPLGYKLSGKTGSGFVGAEYDLRLAWWIGFVEKENQSYAVVVNYTDKQKLAERTFGGAEAKQIAKDFLSQNKLW